MDFISQQLEDEVTCCSLKLLGLVFHETSRENSSVKLVHKDSDLQCCIIHAVLLKTNNYGLSKMLNTIYRINRLQWVAVSFPCFEFLFINLIKVWRFISIMKHLKGFCQCFRTPAFFQYIQVRAVEVLFYCTNKLSLIIYILCIVCYFLACPFPLGCL